MKCSIISPEGKQEFDDVKSVTLPAFSGELQILPGHAEGFVLLQKGDIVLVLEGEQTHTLPVGGGVCHVANDNVTVAL